MKKQMFLLKGEPKAPEKLRKNLVKQDHEKGCIGEGKDALQSCEPPPLQTADMNICPAAYSGWGINE